MEQTIDNTARDVTMSLPHAGQFSERLGCRDWLDFRYLKLGGVIAARSTGLCLIVEARAARHGVTRAMLIIGFV